MSDLAHAPEPRDAPPPPRPRRRSRWVWRSLAVLLAILALVIGGIAWLVTTPEGARLVLGRVSSMMGEGTKLSGVEGRIGGLLRIDAIEISRPDLYVRVDGFEMDTSALDPLRGRLLVHRLAARSVEVRTASTGAAARIPVTFQPPYPVKLEEARVGELRLGALTPRARDEKDVVKRRAIMNETRDKDFVVRAIVLRGEGDKTRWKVDEARAQTAYGEGSLSGTLDTQSPFALDANAEAKGAFGERGYHAVARLKGTLKKLEANLEGEVSDQHATGRVVLEPFNPVPVRSLDVQAQDVDLSRFSAAPPTRLAVDVKLDAESGTFAGPIRIENAQPGPWDRHLLPFGSATARVVVTPGRMDIADLSVALAGGASARGRAVVQNGGVEADLRVADVNLAALHGGLQKTRMTGRLAVSGTREAQRFELALKDPRFQVDGRGALANERLDIEAVRVATGGGAVTAKGAIALKGAREFRFEGHAGHFDPAAFVKTTAGDLNFDFVATGSLADGIAGELRADVRPSRYAGLPASGRIRVAGDKSRLASSDIHLALGDGRIDATGSFGRKGDVLDVAVHAPNLSAFAKPLGVAMAGRLDARAQITGTVRAIAGTLDLSGADLALPSDVFIREITVRGQAGTEADSPIDATVQARGVAIGKDKPPTSLAQNAKLTLRGTRADHRLTLDADVTRESSVKAALQGGLDPRTASFSWRGRVESLALTGPGAFALQAPTPLKVAATQVELGDATLRGDWGEARLAVTRWTPRTLDLRGSSAGIEIRNLARSLKLGDAPRSSLVVAGDWDVHASETFDGHVSLRRVSGDLRLGEPPLPLGLQKLELDIEAVRNRARASVAIAGQRIGRVAGEGTALLELGPKGWQLAKAAPVNARIDADVPDLSVFDAWLGPDAKIGGRLNANVLVSGTGESPQLSGEAHAQGLAMREPQSGFEIERGDAAVRLAGRTITVDHFTAYAPWHPSPGALRKIGGSKLPEAGQISAEGSIELDARKGSLRVKATQVPVTQITTRFLAVSGEAALDSKGDGIVVNGAFKADAGWIGALASAPPAISDDVVVVRAAKPAAPPESRSKEKVVVDLRFALGDRVYFEGRGLDTRLVGDLHVTGEPSSLRATGAIRTQGGSYDGYGQKLTIERGALSFNGPIDNPQLNVRAVRTGLPVEAGVEVTGSVARPRVRLVSTPDVPEPEKLSWLVLGRGPSDLGPGDASVLLAAATSMLGKNNPGADIGEKLGFDEVKIGRTDTQSVLGVLPQSTVAGRTGAASAAEVVTVGKRLGRNVHLAYEQGLGDAEGALRVTLQLTRQFQLLVRAGYLPGLDVVYRWTFR